MKNSATGVKQETDKKCVSSVCVLAYVLFDNSVLKQRYMEFTLNTKSAASDKS
jgi:hypothetical protein